MQVNFRDGRSSVRLKINPERCCRTQDTHRRILLTSRAVAVAWLKGSRIMRETARIAVVKRWRRAMDARRGQHRIVEDAKKENVGIK